MRDAVGPTAPVERLGLDEMFVDATDLIDTNLARLLAEPDEGGPRSDLFVLSNGDDGPRGFTFDSSSFAGCIVGGGNENHPTRALHPNRDDASLSLHAKTHMRLLLGSHLAAHLRHRLEHDAAYTSSAGIATSKLLSKLAGKVNKPSNQTTLVSAAWIGDAETGTNTDADNNVDTDADSVVWQFMDPLPLRSVPGIGFKTSSLLSSYFLSAQDDARKEEVSEENGHRETENGDQQEEEDEADHDDRPVVTVMDVRTFPGMSPRLLDTILGSHNDHRHSITGPVVASTGNIPTGLRVWHLLHGVDDTSVRGGRDLPSQISIEDTYAGPRQGTLRPDAATAVAAELHKLATSLLRRMHVDLLESPPTGNTSSRSAQIDTETTTVASVHGPRPSWLARPRTLRLTLRPQMPHAIDNKEPNNYFARMSHSQPLPSFVLSLTTPPKQIVDRLVANSLVPMFRKLTASVHMGRRASSESTTRKGSPAWTVGLLNVCVANMAPVAGRGDDIAAMFKRQDNGSNKGHSPNGNFEGFDEQPNHKHHVDEHTTAGRESSESDANDEYDDGWGTEEDSGGSALEVCVQCGHFLPAFATAAHARYHLLGN
jgi:DNA polymerase iota